MAKTWDQNMRTLIHFDPQTFVDLVSPGAQYVQQRPEKLRNWQLDLKLVGFTLASLVFNRKKSKLDWKWLQKRFKHMHDILRESPIYQLILKEGRQEGRQKGRQEGRKEGRQEGREEGLKALRQSITDVVQIRFPDLVGLTQQHVAEIQDPDGLRRLTVEMVKAQSLEDARQALLA